jgi:hypothetical protein
MTAVDYRHSGQYIEFGSIKRELDVKKGKPLILLILWLCSVSSSLTQTVSWFGIVRCDGLMIPFAQYEGHWSLCWPEAGHDQDQIIATLSDLPKSWLGKREPFPPMWKCYSLDGRISSLVVRAPILAKSRCDKMWGISTDYSPVSTARSWPYPKVGLAIVGNLDIRLPEHIGLTRDDNSQLVDTIKAIFNKKENELVGAELARSKFSDQTSDNIPFSQEMRAKNEITIRQLVKIDPNVFYFECGRKYPIGNDSPWQGYLDINGWIIQDRDNKDYGVLDLNVIRGPGATAERESCQVLGWLNIGQETYIFVEEDYYEWEYYSVLRISPSGLETVVKAWGGGC